MNATHLGIALLAASLFPAGAGSADDASGRSEWAYEQLVTLDRGRIGVQIQSMTPELREHFDAPSDRGLLVVRVEEDRPADRAGLRVGDVLLSADGKPLRRPHDLVKAVARVREGEALELAIVRGGKERSVAVKPEGGAVPWVDPDHWRDRATEGLREGRRQLRRRMDQIERRLEQLERELQEQRREWRDWEKRT